MKHIVARCNGSKRIGIASGPIAAFEPQGLVSCQVPAGGLMYIVHEGLDTSGRWCR